VVVGDVGRVQLRASSASGEAPADLELSVVNPGSARTDAAGAAMTASSLGAAAGTSGGSGAIAAEPALFGGGTTSVTVRAAAGATNPPGVRAPRPRIRTRAAWGANERLRSGRPSYGRVRAGFVHHTVNANGYRRAQVPAIIRGIYAFHTQSNGWSDIGYNFLVDRFGRIWQGRFGDLRRNVIGAHTFGYNHVSFAMSAIGNFETARPSAPMLRAYGRLMGWRLGKYGINAGAMRRRLEGRTFRAISGHRDAGSTACPGIRLYRKIGTIRRLAVNWQQNGTTTAPAPTEPPPTEPPPTEPPPEPTQPRPAEPDRLRDLQADGFPDLVIREKATDKLKLLVGDGGPGFHPRRTAAETIGSTALFTVLGDVTGDGRPDLLVRHPTTKVAKVRPGRANGRFGRAIAPTRRFESANLLAGVGNMVGTRRPDVIARDASTGKVWIYRGQADGRWGRKSLLMRGAGRLSLLGAAGDLNRDRKQDIVARDGRRLMLYAGRGNGRVAAPRVIARGWGGKDLAVVGRDVTGDGAPDIVARDRSTRRTWIYATKDNGAVGRRFGGWKTWKDLNRLTGTADITRDGTPDLLGRAKSGSLVAFSSLGTRWLQGPMDTGRLAGNANFAQVVGDWNGDSFPDVVTRVGGVVYLYRGTAGGGLQQRVRMWGNWANHTNLVAPGDINGDGRPDLVGRIPGDDGLWLFPSNGAAGKSARVKLREFLFKTDLIAAAGFWNDDAVRDLVVRRRGSKDLYLVPGNNDGTFRKPVLLRGGRNFEEYDRLVGVGDFNGDRQPDLLAREAGAGRLWLFPGTTSGLKARKYIASGLDRYNLIG
jgi:hypothetical protein